MQYLHPDARVLIFAKAPQPGRVKTRLIDAIGATAAAELYAGLLVRTIERIAAPAIAPVQLWCAPDPSHPLFLAAAQRWGLGLRTQGEGGLGARMGGALEAVLAECGYAVLIGSDIPGMDAAYVARALSALQQGADAVLGPAEDGGYTLIGLRRYHPRVFEAIAWGGERVAEETRARFRELAWGWQELPPLWDLDRPEDLSRLAASERVGAAGSHDGAACERRPLAE